MLAKSRKITILAAAALSVLSVSTAHAACRDDFEDRAEHWAEGAAEITGFSLGLAAPVGVVFLLVAAKPHSIAKLLAQTDSCWGKQIQHLYKRYRRNVENPISLSDFCETLHKADVDGRLCNGNHVPSKSEIIERIDLDSIPN